jgi:protein SCO1/2
MRTGTTALMAGTVAVAGLAAMALWPAIRSMGTADDPFAPCRTGQVAGGAVGGPFELVDARGTTVTDAEVFRTPTILYFGFVSCPDVCPLDLARNAQAVDLLEAGGVLATPVFVTVDPARDTPEVVGAYAAAMHPRMIGLTGTPEQVDAAAKAWRVYYARRGEDPVTYTMDHSSFSYLVLPGVGFVDFVDREAAPEEVAERMACLVEAAEV